MAPPMAENGEQPVAEIRGLQCVAQCPGFVYVAVIKIP